jgi:hypothetical protein
MGGTSLDDLREYPYTFRPTTATSPTPSPARCWRFL